MMEHAKKTDTHKHPPKNIRFGFQPHDSKMDHLIVYTRLGISTTIKQVLSIRDLLKVYKDKTINSANIHPAVIDSANTNSDYFGRTHVVSRDCSVLAVGATGVNLNTTIGIHPESHTEHCKHAGIVCVFRWQDDEYCFESILLPKYIQTRGFFGSYLKISPDGNTITAGKYAPGIEYAEISNLLDDTFRVDADITTYSCDGTSNTEKEWIAKDL